LKWHSRDFANGDKTVIELFGDNDRDRSGAEYWDWLESNPAGRPIIRVVEYEDKIIGHLVGMPIQMKLGSEFLGSLIMDGGVHPDYRRRGIMRELLRDLLSQAASRGLALDWGVTEVGKPMQILGMQLGSTAVRAGRMKNYYLILNLGNILRKRNDMSFSSKMGAILMRMAGRARRLEPIRNVLIERISEFNTSFDELWEERSHDYDSLLIKRSRAYLDWRYSLHPEHKYLIWGALEAGHLVGYAISRHDHNERSNIGFIVDIFGRRDVLSMLISHVVTYFEKHDVDFVKCELSNRHPYARDLKRIGLVEWSSNMGLQFIIPSPLIGVKQEWLVRKGNCMMSWGDGMII
jgi:GNAT superfamily N-acetyltransferase